MKPSITDEQRDYLISEVMYYFKMERDEDISQMVAGFILDFFLEKLEPLLYNKGLEDAKYWFSQKLEDLDYAFDELKRG